MLPLPPIRPLALLPCCLGPHLGDFAPPLLRAEHRRELRKQRPVVSGHRSIFPDHGVG